MDLSKYPLEKIFYFATGIIPGFLLLLIFDLHSPGSFGWFFAMGFLGYKSKLSLILILSFVIGNSLTTFLKSTLGGIGGALGAAKAKEPYNAPHTYSVAPWREPTWRTVLKKKLGAQAPDDTLLISQDLFDLREKMVDLLPEDQRPSALATLLQDKFTSEINDGNWARWCVHYHHVVLNPDKVDFYWYVQHGFSFNLETAALYVLFSLPFVPRLWHWWCYVPAIMWVLLLIAEEYSGLLRYQNHWSTLTAQTRYLSRTDVEREKTIS